MTKRDFLRSMTVTALAATAAGRALRASPAPQREKPSVSGDFWDEIRAGYSLDPDRINFENGYYCILPDAVLESAMRRTREQNRLGSYYLRTRMADEVDAVRRELAEFAGCSAEELIITRNTTESLDTVISGIDWQRGDEAVMSAQDYGSMLEMFGQQAKRHGIVNRTVSLPMDPQSDEEIVRLYESAITPRTRLIMVCHLVNITGQILPVRKICDMAHAHGVPVMVDGAHSFAHLDFRIPDLGCDYFGTSLHKWLAAPLGVGLLYVRRDRIAGLWPLLGDVNRATDDVRKLNHIGTNPVQTILTIPDALAFHRRIGFARKEARLRFLQEYWTKEMRGLPGVALNTPSQSQRACAIANIGFAHLSPAETARRLLVDHRIWTVAIDSQSAGVHGVRITPNLFTSTGELDQLVAALKELAKGK